MADMNKPLFDIDKPGMQVALDSYKPGTGLAWAQLFPLKYTSSFDLKGIEGNEGIPVAADRVAFNTKSPKKTRKTIGSWSGRLGKYSVSREKDEREINDYNDLVVKAAANTEDAALAREIVDVIYDDVQFCNDAINYKVEIDAMRVGSSGKQTFPAEIEGDMATQDEINFNVPAENFGGASVAWSSIDAADGLKDIAMWADKIAKKGGRRPRYAIMEKAKFNELCEQKSVARRLFPRYDQNLVTSDMVTLEAVNRYNSTKGYPTILVIDTYATIEHKDGRQETIKPWNEDVVVLSPEPRLGYTYYKTVPNVPNTAAVQAYGAFFKATRYSALNPMLEVTMAECYVQPALSNRASLVFINTTKTTW